VAAASSVSRRPGSWIINEIGINAGLVDRNQEIKLYVWVAKTVFPEITDGTFLADWFATVDGHNGNADYDNDDVWVFRPTLPVGTPLHAAVADFEDDLTAAPTIQGTVSNTATSIPVLFTYNPVVPDP
jgi:hypothetical protein